MQQCKVTLASGDKSVTILVTENEVEEEMKEGQEEEEHKGIHEGRTSSSRPIGPYEVVCDTLHYLFYSEKNRTGKVKAPPHPPLPPSEAGRKKGKIHVAWKTAAWKL